jgi:hypothetical protein
MTHQDAITAGERIPLSHLIRAMLALSAQLPAGYRATGKEAPGYRTLHLAVLADAFPAMMHNGRWYVAVADIPAIAEHLGLIEPTQDTASVWLPARRQVPHQRGAWPSQVAQQPAKPAPQRRKVPSAA